MRQVETSRTILLDAPRHTRSFFEALVADNLDLGRPESVEIIFGRHRGREAGGVFKTAIDRHTHGVTINVFYKHSRVKQYLKDGRALRIETVINDAYDIGCQRLLPNLDDLAAKSRAINQRVLDTERVRPHFRRARWIQPRLAPSQARVDEWSCCLLRSTTKRQRR